MVMMGVLVLRFSLLFSLDELVDPHVVNYVLLGEVSAAVWVTWPVATYSQVQQDVHPLSEWPVTS